MRTAAGPLVLATAGLDFGFDPMIPQVVVFDLGKVLVDFDYGISARKFAARGTMSAAAIQRFVDHSPLLYRFETGLLTNEQFFQELQKTIGFRGDFGEFTRIFADIFWPIAPMVTWHQRLREHGLPTYIFSNTNELAVTHIRRQFPFYSRFDGYIYSYAVGAMKPDAKIYEALEALAGRRGAEILYLDDRLENIEAGRARGWQVIQQVSSEQSLAAAGQLGLPV